MIEDFSWGYSQSQLKDLGAQHTAREIAQQPQLWLDTYHLLLQQQDKIQHFLNGIYDQDKLRIILTGAGTSAYIGNILQGSFQQQDRKSTRLNSSHVKISYAVFCLK